MTERVLLLGCTGLNKFDAASKIKTLAANDNRNVDIVKFEQTYLPQNMAYSSWRAYLNQNIYQQATCWHAAWKVFLEENTGSERHGTNILVIHGTLVDGSYGVRAGVNIERICADFQPTLVVTLIANVFQMWQETERRAKGETRLGRPNLEQLIMARRVESLIGDQIVSAMDSHKGPVLHAMFSVNHPVSALRNIVLHRARPVYLSFPISAPRELLGSKDITEREFGETLARQINKLHHIAMRKQEANHNVAFISPLTIDELPFKAHAEIAVESKSPDVNFQPQQQCWSLSDLWPGAELVCPISSAEITIPTNKVSDVRGLMLTDVGWRDSRLALQSKAIAVFSPAVPKMENGKLISRLPRGVRTEIELAVKHDIPCYVYQDPAFDPSGEWKKYFGTMGTMGETNPLLQNVTQLSSLEDLIDRAAEA